MTTFTSKFKNLDKKVLFTLTLMIPISELETDCH